ncbi:hypothetical protein [Halobellus sp. GM3]|uniref:hypothetical protein n=1 Tax=Halobellus sp. GM3 TaxID=3458410 RepID=UPI00403E0E5D
MGNTETRSPTPPREDVIPGSYAVHVGEDRVHVWEFRVTASDRDGAWSHCEMLAHESGPFLSLEYAEFTPAGDEGYWVYCRSYECNFDCE